MKVKFRINLGSKDAKNIGVDFKQCQKNCEVDVPDKAGNWLVSTGIAVAMQTEPKPEPPSEPKPAPLAAKVKQVEKPQNKET